MGKKKLFLITILASVLIFPANSLLTDQIPPAKGEGIQENNGKYIPTARAVEAVSNSSDKFISSGMDLGQPDILISSPSNGQVINLSNVTIAGTASSDSIIESVTVSMDGSEEKPVSFDSISEEWSYDVIDMYDGEHHVTATAADSAGKEAAVTISFIVDTQGPAIAITTVENHRTFNFLLTNPEVTVTGHAYDRNGIESVLVKIDDGPYENVTRIERVVIDDGPEGWHYANVTGIEPWSFNAVLENGYHTITAKAVDTVGNSATDSKPVKVGVPHPDNSALIIQGVVFHDANCDGVRQDDESGIEGWRVWIGGFDNEISEPIISNTVTDVEGIYSFTDY
ncbi:MAG: Ig-like domain-containing protein, partial [Nitrososphaerales archaeon]